MEKNTSPGWLTIELRHLAALQAVAEERSFVRAAERLGYTQSAISNQIAALERLVSTRLVERTRGGGPVGLTDAGTMLYEHALVLMSRLHAARSDVAASRPGKSQPVRIGCDPSVGASILPSIAQLFGEEFPCPPPELRVEAGECGRQEAVADGSLDLAVVWGPPRIGSLAATHLLDDPFVLLAECEANGPGARDFDARPVLAQGPGSLRHWHEAALRATPGAPKGPVVFLEDATTIQALVGVGWAYGLLPALSVTNTDLHAEVIDGTTRDLHLIWQRDRSLTDALERLIEIFREAFTAHRSRSELLCGPH